MFSGPPSDPSYNFLADAERDGKVTTTIETGSKSDNDKNWRANNYNNNNNNNSNLSANNMNRRGNNNNSSFNRGKNGAKAKNVSNKGKNDEIKRPDDLRNLLHRQKPSDGKWRDTDKPKEQPQPNRSKFTNNGKPAGGNDYPAPHQSDENLKSNQRSPPHRAITKNESCYLPQKISELAIEKRGNITVSVTKDGEVKSVKCKFCCKLKEEKMIFKLTFFFISVESTRAIGTGRVGSGNRQTIAVTQYTQSPPIVESPMIINPLNTVNDFSQFTTQQIHQPIQQFQAVQQSVQSIQPVEQMLSNKPAFNIVNGQPFKLPSVQDRLTRNRIFFDDNLKNTTGVDASNTQVVTNNP